MALPGRTRARRRSTIVLIVALMMIVGVVAAAGAAPKDKRDVCHRTSGTFGYVLINVSENAFKKHIAHGDVSPGEDVPGMPGWIYGADCTPYHSYWLNNDRSLSPDELLKRGYDPGGLVSAAQDAGYAGILEFTEWVDSSLPLEFEFDFSLAPSTTYQMWLDRDGGDFGPWQRLGEFETDASGVGAFDYYPDNFATPTTINYSFFVNDGNTSLLMTDSDLNYTTH